MKKAAVLLVCTAMLFSTASADQTVSLPGTRYAVDVPDSMEYSAPGEEDNGVHAYISETLEMDYLSYTREEAALPGTLRETAETLAASGVEAEVRDVNGIEMLVYRVTDEADGAQAIGYVFEDGGMIVEVVFWYATQEAADTAKKIMETVRREE